MVTVLRVYTLYLTTSNLMNSVVNKDKRSKNTVNNIRLNKKDLKLIEAYLRASVYCK